MANCFKTIGGLSKPIVNYCFQNMVVMSKSLATHIPSGKHTKNSWKWPSRIVVLPIKKVIFHSFFQNRVIYHQTVKNRVILPIKIVPIKLPIEKVIFHSYVAVYQRVQFLQQLLPWWWSTCLSIPRLDEFPPEFHLPTSMGQLSHRNDAKCPTV